MAPNIATITCLLVVSGPVFAFTKIIATVGPTTDIKPYMQVIQGSQSQRSKSLDPKKSYRFSYKTDSKELTPGIVKTRKINNPMLKEPIFIVGDDDLSMKWLDKYASKLKTIKAIGVIVNIKDSNDYHKITNKYGLPLLSVNGDGIAKSLGIRHYPVLIGQHVIEQ
ncbi:MAG: integrating conjugative element protein [Gammaproteobacteria bacterium]|nr:integrating conjugative element protein [Gammaproteobacteria bacterium]